MLLLYLQFSLLGIALSLFVKLFTKHMSWPIYLCISTGFALVPVFISLYVWFIGMVWPGAPKGMFLYPPLILATLYIIFTGVCFGISRNANSKIRTKIKPNPLSIILFVLVIVFVCFGLTSAFQYFTQLCIEPIDGFDIAHYLSEARFFAEYPNSWLIDSAEGVQFGKVLSDDHGPFYVTYYAHALLQMSPNIILALESNILYFYNIATYLSTFLLLFSVVSYITRNIISGFVAIFAFLLLNYLRDFIRGYSRDGFSMIGVGLFWLAICTLIYNINKEENTAKLNIWPECLFLCFSTFFALQGHGIIFLLIAPASIVLLVFFVLKKIPFNQILMVFFSIAIGAFLGLLKIIIRWFTSGYIRSYTSQYTKGTPIYEATQALRTEFFELDQPGIMRAKLWDGNRGVLLGLAIVLVFFVLVYCWQKGFKKSNRQEKVLLFASFTFLLLMPPILGMVGVKLLSWFYQNNRYSLYIFFSATLVLVSLLWYILEQMLNEKHRKFYEVFLLVAVSISVSCTVHNVWQPQLIISRGLADDMVAISQLLEKHSDPTIISDYARINIYLPESPYIIVSSGTADLIQAKTTEEVASLLEQKDITVYVHFPGEVHGIENTSFYHHIINNWQQLELETESGFTVYKK